MKAGDTINGYTLLEDFRVVGAGLSEWTFAERGGREYFIKRFLSPTYPDDAAPGSATTKERKRARCAAFEAHHRGIQAALAPITAYGGNLIATLDFFRYGAKYYKVTEKVDPAGLDAAAVADLAFPTKLVLLKTVAHSLKILHDLRHRAQRPETEQRADQEDRVRLHHQAHRLRQLLHRRKPAATRRDRRHDELLLARTGALHPGDSAARRRTHHRRPTSSPWASSTPSTSPVHCPPSTPPTTRPPSPC